MSDNVFAPPRSNVETQTGPAPLWEMTLKELRKIYLASLNVRALGILYALGAVGILAAGLIPLASSATKSGLEVIFIVIGLMYAAACVSSYTRPTWGRWLGIVICVLALLSFPFGTIIGILGLIAYAQGGKLFGPEKFVHAEVVRIYKERKQAEK